MAAREGRELARKYRLEKLLGTGGMGEVWRAQNVLLGRTVAIKLMHAELARDGELVARFQREARAANLFKHANVVDVIDIGIDEGVPFIVQEFLEGEDLARYTTRRGGKLTTTELLTILYPIAEAMAAAHATGVVHRDLKPDNVFLAKEHGTVVPKLLDFGVSQIAQPEGSAKQTTAGVTVGTPAYMSPEQLQGHPVDARTDIWAFGVMLHELAAASLPFQADSPILLLAQIATREPPRLTTLVPDAQLELEEIILRCLRRERGDRFADASELAKALKALLRKTLKLPARAPETVKGHSPLSAPPGPTGTGTVKGHAVLSSPPAAAGPIASAGVDVPDLAPVASRRAAPPKSQAVPQATTAPIPRSPAEGGPQHVAPIPVARPSPQKRASGYSGAGIDDDDPSARLEVERVQLANRRVARSQKVDSPSSPAVDSHRLLSIGLMVAGIAGGGMIMQFAPRNEDIAPLITQYVPGPRAAIGFLGLAIFVGFRSWKAFRADDRGPGLVLAAIAGAAIVLALRVH